MVPAVKLDRITKRYHTPEGEISALEDITFSVQEGEFVGIVGPSGCGKTTLLSIISGLLEPSAGKVYIFGEESHGVNPKIGYMLQRDSLFEWRTIYRNVMLGLEIKNEDTPENI